MKKYDVIIIGGGAAGFFAGINIAEQNPKLSIAILEKSKEGLQKVKVSGGGRCNVTHAEFLPKELSKNYPRGEKELLGPFHTFMTGDVVEWFETRGVELKTEADGRMFPVTDSSQTIIDCFLREAKKHKVEVLYGQNVTSIECQAEHTCPDRSVGSRSLNEEQYNHFKISTKTQIFTCQKLLVATGSSPKMWRLIAQLGHTIVPPVPSLFTFNINDKRIAEIPGVVVKDVDVKVLERVTSVPARPTGGHSGKAGTLSQLKSTGPLLITHWGLSAPAILKLSAFGALELAKMDYKFSVEINFVRQSFEDCLDFLKVKKQELAKKTVFNSAQFELPKRLWQQLVLASRINKEARWADVNKAELISLAKQLTQAVFKVDGKSTFKEEFVTAGGVDLKEINFKTFESKLHSNLYFAGEVLNIDAVTGGFNFQNAWTGSFIAAKNMALN